MNPTRKWIVAAVCDDEDNIAQITAAIESDISEKTTMYEFEIGKPFPYSVRTVPTPIPIERLIRCKWDYDRYFDICIGTHVREGIKRAPDYWGLTLLLNRDLLTKHGIEDKFTPIVKHNYFKRTNHENHVICCFGGTPKQDMRCRIPSTKSCINAFDGCYSCKDSDTLINCKHTCYWYLINLMLLESWPRDKNKNIIIGDKRFLPSAPYIY